MHISSSSWSTALRRMGVKFPSSDSMVVVGGISSTTSRAWWRVSLSEEERDPASMGSSDERKAYFVKEM
jgi:hypothetical protein